MNIDWSNILETVFISGIVSGTFVFLLQKWISLKFKKIEGKIEQEQNLKNRNHEIAVEAFQKVWYGLMKIENFAKVGISKEIEAGHVDAEKWTFFYETYNFVRENSILIPEELYEKTIKLLERFADDTNNLLSYLKNVSVAQKSEGYNKAETRKEVEIRVNQLYHNYRESLDELREDYRKITTEMVLK